MVKQWQVLQNLGSKASADDIIKLLLKNRRLNSQKKIDEFFCPSEPEAITLKSAGIKKEEINKAVKRIKKAIEKSEKIIVYGDYDADGICGTAILWKALDRLGAQSLPYIPKRQKEGYGLSIEGIENVKRQTPATKLIITVDNGITANKAIDYARKKEIDVIIVDHHLSLKKLPKAVAIVHTAKLSGSGVAWFLARELTKHLQSGVASAAHLEDGVGLELAAIGTVADMMPLIGVNRSLVKYGLLRLRRTSQIGLHALFEKANLEKTEVDVWSLSFIIVPRLNASGRLTDAMNSLRLLCTRDPVRAKNLAQRLEEENRERRQLTRQTFLHVKKLLLSSHSKLLFAAHHSYHEGIVGLVAGRLVQEFYRPAIIFSVGREFSKGSARSIVGLNIIEAIRQCDELLVDAGGHPMAAGLTVRNDNLKRLEKQLGAVIEKELKGKELSPTLLVDCELKLSNLTWKLYENIEKFGPFGMGNAKPVFCSRGLRVVGFRTVGNNGNHLKIKLDDPRTKKIEEVLAFDGIGFGMGSFSQKIKVGSLVDIAYTLEKNVWQGEEKLELKIKDIRIC